MSKILDRPWRRPGALSYALQRFRSFFRPAVTIRDTSERIEIDRDVPVSMRDGVMLRVNVYRPIGDGPFPVLLSAHPYGKDKFPQRTRRGWSVNPQYRVMNQSKPFEISRYTGWEAPDPVWWTKQGFVVINADLRGAGTSDGVGSLLSHQEAEDIYDLIEWAAVQSWSTGNVGMLGVSYLAISQYQVAALHPPSLKAICPWEGFTDAYRDFMTPGGVVEKGFASAWAFLTNRFARLTDDLGKQRKNHPTRDDWWEGLDPDLANITVPTLVCTSFSDHNLHSNGSFRLFTDSNSTDKFAYTHRGAKWLTFYSDEALRAQLNFFDRYLRGRDTPKPPPIRLEVRESRNVIAEVRDENEWPLARTDWRGLFLNRDGQLSETRNGQGHVTFDLRRNAASFTFPILADMEITGPMSLHCWVSLEKGDDANLFVGVEKWRGDTYIPFESSYGYGRGRITIGMQRIALRELDASSSPEQPVRTLRNIQKLEAGAIVPLTIPLSASSTVFRAGDSLRLLIGGRYLEPSNPLTGHFPARYVPSREGRCTIHWGAQQPSVLRIPVIPKT